MIMHPILFEIWNYPLYLYSLVITVGCILRMWLIISYGDRAGMNRLTLLTFVGGYPRWLLGTRVVYGRQLGRPLVPL